MRKWRSSSAARAESRSTRSWVARVAADEGEGEDGRLQLADGVVGDELGKARDGALGPGRGGLREELDHASIFAGAGRAASRAPRIQTVAAPRWAVRASEAKEDDRLLAGDEERQEAPVAAAPRRGEDEPEGEREERGDAEGGLEEERLDGAAQDEAETRREGEEGVRRLRQAERGARLGHDRPDRARGAEEGEEAQEREARPLPVPPQVGRERRLARELDEEEERPEDRREAQEADEEGREAEADDVGEERREAAALALGGEASGEAPGQERRQGGVKEAGGEEAGERAGEPGHIGQRKGSLLERVEARPVAEEARLGAEEVRPEDDVPSLRQTVRRRPDVEKVVKARGERSGDDQGESGVQGEGEEERLPRRGGRHEATSPEEGKGVPLHHDAPGSTARRAKSSRRFWVRNRRRWPHARAAVGSGSVRRPSFRRFTSRRQVWRGSTTAERSRGPVMRQRIHSARPSQRRVTVFPPSNRISTSTGHAISPSRWTTTVDSKARPGSAGARYAR